MLFETSYIEALNEVNDSTQSATPNGVLLKENPQGTITWKNDALKILSFSVKGIQDYLNPLDPMFDPLKNNRFQSAPTDHNIIDYDGSYIRKLNVSPPSYPTYNNRGKIAGTTINGTSAVMFPNPAHANAIENVYFDGGGGLLGPQVIQPKVVPLEANWLVRAVNPTEIAYIGNLNLTYQQIAIAYMLWNLVTFSQNTDFETKFFGANHTFFNYGVPLFKQNNGAAFASAYFNLINHVGPQRNGVNVQQSIANSDGAILVDWIIRVNPGDGKPYLHLNVQYQDNRLYPHALYEHLFWSFLHRQMFFLLQGSYSGLVAGNISLSAATQSYASEDAITKKFVNSLFLQVFDITTTQVVTDELLVLNIIQPAVSSTRFPLFSNQQELDYLYNTFKTKDLTLLTNFSNYYTAMFKNI